MSVEGSPRGWTVLNGVLAPGNRAADFAAREQTVKGICRAKGCSRRVELDPKSLCGQGLGLLSMKAVEKLWMCQRLDGCGLDFHAETPLIPLRLGQFVGRPNVRLRVRCRAGSCTFFRIWRVEEMIAGLEKRGHAGDRTEVEALGGMMSSACPMCKKVNWAAEVLWIDTGTMGWKAMGERSFDRLEAG